jgi:hypothetical protein
LLEAILADRNFKGVGESRSESAREGDRSLLLARADNTSFFPPFVPARRRQLNSRCVAY